MSARAAHHSDQQRRRICAEAARLMADEGIRDFHAAKRRACDRLGLDHDHRHWPANHEIEAALQEHLKLFHAQTLPARRRRLRQLALEAMDFLDRFQPRLVGAVLTGTVTDHTAIELLLTADTAEEIGHFLDEHGIPHDTHERRLRYGGDRQTSAPAYRFDADGVTVELAVLDRVASREPPLSPVDGKPMHRASRREVEELLNHGN
ncbi:MAG: hypothetical protein A2140_08930 [Candidatus Muproteobacteria bacterium RBG_16_62_13]|uniref:Nucleotidyltransferase n=1 Tax=Candidatus Muproteobacteria bacterium RBG_16_62_13 TaxID=1817756 RepID=A0A1F6T8H8_9PROT|nr:MAG: hypothetical protein A2140_08930 [Candidatus Muproteobacteria bacterium RBG_16_62_13]